MLLSSTALRRLFWCPPPHKRFSHTSCATMTANNIFEGLCDDNSWAGGAADRSRYLANTHTHTRLCLAPVYHTTPHLFLEKNNSVRPKTTNTMVCNTLKSNLVCSGASSLFCLPTALSIWLIVIPTHMIKRGKTIAIECSGCLNN